MAESEFIVALDETNFVEVVVEGSAKVPVLVDFWADWCGPCKSLMPILEKLAVEYNGAFVLAKLDTEAHQGIAQQLGIRSLPTVKLFSEGRLVDEFMGALPEPEVRAFLEKHITAGEAPVQEDPGLQQAMMLFESGDIKGSRELLQQMQAADPTDIDVLLTLGQVCIADQDLDTAESCANALPEAEQDSVAGRRLKATIALAREADGSESAEHWQQKLDSDANNSEARYHYAVQTAVGGNFELALDELLTLLQKDPNYNEGAPRKKLLELFDALGDDPLAGQYRRKMFALLH